MSGAGAWARDPDSILVMTPHEERECFTVSCILRNLPLLPEFVVRWEFPLVRSAPELNPEALRRPQSKNKVCTDREFVEQVLTEAPRSRGAIVKTAEERGISSATTDRYLKRLSEAGVIGCGSGLYWRLAAWLYHFITSLIYNEREHQNRAAGEGKPSFGVGLPFSASA